MQWAYIHTWWVVKMKTSAASVTGQTFPRELEVSTPLAYILKYDRRRLVLLFFPPPPFFPRCMDGWLIVTGSLCHCLKLISMSTRHACMHTPLETIQEHIIGASFPQLCQFVRRSGTSREGREDIIGNHPSPAGNTLCWILSGQSPSDDLVERP